MALSKNRIKYIHSLEQKKNRKADKVFLAEGPKLVGDLLGHFPCQFLLATSEWLSRNRPLSTVTDVTEVSEEELSRASLLKTPQQVLAVFRQPDEETDISVISHSLCLALDDVQDPGNLGTIVRLADWFGIEHIFCSPNTVDIYNPKTIRATMGSLYRVPFVYMENLEEAVSLLKKSGITTYAAHLKGEKFFHQIRYSGGNASLIGNQGNGLKTETAQLADTYLKIPMEGKLESLNASVAAALLLYQAAGSKGRFTLGQEK